MIELPFDKWSLNFQSRDFEDIYESSQNEKRLRILRILSSGLAIVALSCLIIFIIQLQPAFLIFEMGAAFGGCSLTLIISGKLVQYLKQVFSFFYILCVATTILINYSGVYVPHYVYGYCTSLLYVSILQYCHNSLKVVFILVTPSLNLGLFGVFDINYLQYILLTLTAVVLLGFFTYQIEYTSRLSFSQIFIIQKQRELLHEWVTEPLFSMVLNERANCLNLSFQNKKFQEFLNVNTQFENDSAAIKEFLRSTFVASKSEEYHLIEFFHKKGKENEKFLTLEDFLFQRLMQSEGNIKNKWQENNIIMMRKQGNDVQAFKLEITKFNYGKPIIIVLIKLDQQQDVSHKFQEQEEQYNKMIVSISTKIADSQELFLKEINSFQQKENNYSQKLQNIQCCNISIITQLKNYMIYFSQNRISYLLQTIDQCKLYQIVETLQTYFQCRANQRFRKFKLINTVSHSQEMKINSKILIQLTINIFEQALNQSLRNDTIFFKIQLKLETQKQQKQRYTSPDLCKQTDVGLSQEACFLKVFQFTFSFITYEKINLLPEIPISQNQTQHSIIQKEPQINQKVSQLLLGMIGPHHHIKVNQVQLEDQTFCNSLTFEIYSDQTKLDQSFTKFSKKY